VVRATRSHTLRAEAEDEFKALCLEFPQFGYDVLSELIPTFSCGGCLGMTLTRSVARVLDDKLKKERNEKMHPATGSGRKRARHSSGGKD
jgi:hypothetical protein